MAYFPGNAECIIPDGFRIVTCIGYLPVGSFDYANIALYAIVPSAVLSTSMLGAIG